MAAIDYFPARGGLIGVTSTSETALGDSAYADSNASTSIGRGAFSGAYCLSIGDQSYSYYLGVAAGRNASAGNNFATAVGHGATAGGSNSMALGYNATTYANNTIVLGNSSISSLRCQVTSITSLSDERDKTNIEPLNIGLDFINSLRPVKFDWNMRDGAKVGIKDFGFIAQEVAASEDAIEAHELLGLTDREDEEQMLLAYGKLVPILVESIKELSQRVAELEQA